MGSHQTPSENRHAQALRIGEVGGYTQPKRRGPVGNVTVNLQRFTGNPSPLVSGAPWWDTSSALAQCVAADAVDSPSLFQAPLSGAADLVSLVFGTNGHGTSV
ncbi:MAG: hypothetical protein ACR2M4_03030 [Actinomycetota bacterium]